jgi:hypothetical protein
MARCGVETSENLGMLQKRAAARVEQPPYNEPKTTNYLVVEVTSIFTMALTSLWRSTTTL